MTTPGSSPDTQRWYLLNAAETLEEFIGGRPDKDGELAARALHLVACVAAVDSMCRDGDLPRAWQRGDAA